MTTWTWMLIVNLAIPFSLFAIGVVMAKRPPKRINHFCGYRTKRSMESQAAWDFANVLIGRIWRVLGLLLLVPYTALMLCFLKASEETVLTVGMALCGCSLALLLTTPIFVERKLKYLFDENGDASAKEDDM